MPNHLPAYVITEMAICGYYLMTQLFACVELIHTVKFFGGSKYKRHRGGSGENFTLLSQPPLSPRFCEDCSSHLLFHHTSCALGLAALSRFCEDSSSHLLSHHTRYTLSVLPALVMEYPDEFRRPLQLSLASLIDHAKAYLDEGTPEAVDHFMRLMLAGRALVNGETRRVFVNPLQGVSYPAEGEYQITGDFDSLIGFCFTLPLKCAMAVYPVPSFQHTLTKTIHIRLQITINQVYLILGL